MTLIALIAGISFPSVSSGIDSLRLRSAGDQIVSFLNTSLDRAGRRQQAVEILVSPEENTFIARSSDLGFTRRLDVPEPVRILSVNTRVDVPNLNPNGERRFLLYPGSAAPRLVIEIGIPQGRRRTITMDPLTGFPRSEPVNQ
jgi:hypothetical protein